MKTSQFNYQVDQKVFIGHRFLGEITWDYKGTITKIQDNIVYIELDDNENHSMKYLMIDLVKKLLIFETSENALLDYFEIFSYDDMVLEEQAGNLRDIIKDNLDEIKNQIKKSDNLKDLKAVNDKLESILKYIKG
jgi:hypothetical protein